jgi:hypothetical protein
LSGCSACGWFYLELARIGSLLFIFADSPSYQTGSSSPIDTFATRLSAQPLRSASLCTPPKIRGQSIFRPSLHHDIFPAKCTLLEVEPRGFEPPTSAMRGRSEGFAVVLHRSKDRLTKPDSRIVPPRTFAIVRAGCRQIVVSCIRKYCASKETLFRDRQVYSTPLHVVLGASCKKLGKG